jgi:Bacterial shufflon protein, N-terminal constant region
LWRRGGANANSVQVGNSYFYGDSGNTALRQNGAVYIQNLAGSGPADIASVGNINSAGTVTAAGNVNASGSVNANGYVWTAGNLNANGSVVVNGGVNIGSGQSVSSPGNMQLEAAGNLYLNPWSSNYTIVGGGGGVGHLLTTGRMESQEYIQPDGIATAGTGCSPNGLIGNSGSGPLFCQSGVWRANAGYNGSYSAGSAFSSTGWILNSSPNAITVHAWGGNNPDASGNSANPCQLTGSVNTVGVVAFNADNNESNAKACFISFAVPSSTSWAITSTPYEGNTGTFSYSVFTPI